MGKGVIVHKKIGEHDRKNFDPSKYFSWMLTDPICYFQETKDGPWYGTDGNIYEFEVVDFEIFDWEASKN